MSAHPAPAVAHPPGEGDAPVAVPDVRHLRVALLSDAIPGRNGVGTYYDDLVQHLRDHVGEVTLITPSPDGEGSGWSVPMPGDPTQTLHFPNPRALWGELADLSPHVIIAATPGVYGVLGLARGIRLRAPVCVAHHTEFSKLADLYWKGVFGGLYRWVLMRWSGALMRLGSVAVAHNQALVEELRDRGTRDVRLVGTPIPKIFLDTPLAPLGREIRRVCFIGRLAPEKELGQVVEAADTHPDLDFRIIGEGALRDEVDARAAELPNLEATGWTSRAGILEALDATDLLVLPSRFETFGTTALEAMARRRLALVSPNCGIVHWPELNEGLFRMDDGEPLTDAIGRLRGLSPEDRRAVAERGHAAARVLNARTITHWLGVLDGMVRRAGVHVENGAG